MLLMYVIYEKPKDYPNEFVVRRWGVNQGRVNPEAEPIGTARTLEEARKFVPFGAYNLGRQEADEPQIVEVWI